MPDLSETIEKAAATPASAQAGGQSATARPIEELIEADRYLASKEVAAGTNGRGGKRSGWNSLRTARAIPPGGA